MQKNNCINPISSECTFYEGSLLKSIPHKQGCDKNLTEVIEQFDAVIFSQIPDVSTLDKKCLTFTTQKELSQTIIDEVCALKDTVDGSSAVDVGEAILDVNCTLNNCDGNNLTLKNLIQSLCNEINVMKGQIIVLQSQNMNNLNLFIPNV